MNANNKKVNNVSAKKELHFFLKPYIEANVEAVLKTKKKVLE